MVFARYIAFILSTYLGKFVKGLNANSVNYSLLRGAFELKNVELVPDILSFSDYFQLESGTIRSLSISIPWHSPYSRRCEVAIRDVAIIVAPRYSQQASSSSFFKSKEVFLAAIQATLADKNKEVKIAGESKGGFLHRLTQTILKNLALRLENVSFKVQDKSGCWQGCSACVTAQIGKLICEASNSNFVPSFVRPEEHDTVAISLYRVISYENFTVQLLHTVANGTPHSAADSPTLYSSSSADHDTYCEEALCSSQGVLTVSWDNSQAPECPNPSLSITLRINECSASWSPHCIAALGVLAEGVRSAPHRTYAWSMRPERRLCQGDLSAVAKWWQYSIQKVVDRQRAARERSRFSWDDFLRRKEFLSSFFYYCLVLLKAPWLPDGLEASIDENQLSHTPTQDVMMCWNAAMWYVKQYEKYKQAPLGTLYTQYLQYCCLHARNLCKAENQPIKKLLALMDIHFTTECAHITTKLDDNLRGLLTKTSVRASREGDAIHAQLSVSSATIVAENAEDSPLLSIKGRNGVTGALLGVSKTGSAPINAQLSVEAITTCLDFSFQELLFSKLASYIVAVKPFAHQNFTTPNPKLVESQDAPKTLELFGEQSFSQFTITVESIVANADGVSLRIQKIESALAPHNPIAVKVQEIVATVKDTNLLQLYSITVTPAPSKECIMVGVVTDRAVVSTDVESFAFVKLLIGTTATLWKRESDNIIVEASSFFEPAEKLTVVETDSNWAPVKISVCCSFLECGALVLNDFATTVTLSDGWHLHISAAGGTTQKWCHSAPPHPQDPFVDVDVWTGAYLRESSFTGSIEDSGIGFLCTLNHVTVCLGDEVAATAEALVDVIMLLIFENADSHVYLRNDHLYTTPYISGRIIGSDVKILLESEGGDLTLLPGYAAAMKGDEASRKAFDLPLPPMPLTVEFLGKECLDVTLNRYGDTRMDMVVVLQNGVNAFLRGTPAHIPLLPSRQGTRAEIDLHLSAPSEADLPVFPFNRVDISLKLCGAAVVAHIPTMMALWTNFNTPSLPLARIRSMGSRVHFSSRPSRPDKTMPPRSPTSVVLEAIGAAALARGSPFSEAGEQSKSAPATVFLEPSPIYAAAVFPTDVTLRVEVEHSELYYPWGDGSVAPLFLHAAVPKYEVALLSRDGCVEVSVRGMMKMPGVVTSLYASHTAATKCGRTSSTDSHSGSLSNGTSDSREQSQYIVPDATERHPTNENVYEASTNTSQTLSAFSDGEEGSGSVRPNGAQKDLQHSSSIQVHVTYTMDSRLPYRPGSSSDALAVSLSGTAVPGSGALLEPLHVCLRSPVEVGAWLTLFTYFNPTNTIPLSTSEAAYSSTTAAFAKGDSNRSNEDPPSSAWERTSGEAEKSSVADTGDNPNNAHCTKTLVRLTPVVLHLPFAGAAVVLWDGIEFSTSPGCSAWSIPQLDVLVHEELLGETARCGVASSSLEKLRERRDEGYSVLSLRSTSVNGSRGVATVPGVLLETQQKRPSAADLRRRLIIPALQGHVSQKTTLLQLESCATLAAVGKVLASHNAQCALLNAVGQHESRRLGLQYACWVTPQAGGTMDAQVQAQLQPFLSPPMVMLFQNACLTYEWESSLQHGVRAGLTVALHNLRCNDYNACHRAERQEGTSITSVRGNNGICAGTKSPPVDSSSDGTSRYPLSPSMPFLVDVSSADAYVWWTLMGPDLVTLAHHENTQGPGTALPSRHTRSVDGEDEWAEEMDWSVKGDRRPASQPPVGTCMPLLLHPVRVHTSIPSSTPAVATNEQEVDFTPVAGKADEEDSIAGKETAKPDRWSSTHSEGSQSDQVPHAASTASFHTMPSTSEGSTATAASPLSSLYPTAAAIAPVFEVSPVQVILSTSAYVVLSDAFMHKHQDGGIGKPSADPPPHSEAAHVYTLVRHDVRRHDQEDGPSSSVSQPPSPLLHHHHRNSSSSSCFTCGSAYQSELGVAHAQAAPNREALSVYRFDSAQQRVWVEKRDLRRAARTVGQRTRGRCRPPTPPFPAAAGAAVNTRKCSADREANLTLLSSVHTTDGLLSSMSAPSLAAAPRLQSRVNVPELCIRLVFFQDLEVPFSIVGEARGFWQRYTAVHTASRRAGMAAENAAFATAADPPTLSMFTFVASAVPALRTLLRTSAHSSSWSRGSSAINSNRQRVELPGPASLLEEHSVDALCIQLRGLVVSSFPDARSIVFDSVTCTSAKSPSRPLLAVEQAELYLPTSSVTYPSMAAASGAVARDFEGSAERGGGQSRAAGASNTAAPFPSSASALPPHQDSGTATGVEEEEDARSGSVRAPDLAAFEATGGTTSGGDDTNCHHVVVTGEVGLRVDSITVDISSTALLTWLNCLVEQPVAALHAAAEEKERWMALRGNHSSTRNGADDACTAAEDTTGSSDGAEKEEPAPCPPKPEPVSLLKWQPGRGLRIYEARDAIWSLEHDITLSRKGLVLFFSSHNTNLMTIMLKGYSIILDEALLLQPDGLHRTVMVIQGGLTVRFVGDGHVQLPPGMRNASLWDSKGSTGVEAALLPFMAIGEGSYLECINVQLGFSETASANASGPEAAVAAAAPPLPLHTTTEAERTKPPQHATLSATAVSPPCKDGARKDNAGVPIAPTAHTLAPPEQMAMTVDASTVAPLIYRSFRLILPRVSLIIEPRQESRQVHVSTAVEFRMSVCGGELLHEDLRCTGLAVFSESIYDAATTTARTAMLAPVDVRVCSSNGRHHAVSLGSAQMDLGRADLLLLSTYAGEVQAVRSYAKYLTHSRVEKELLELVEETLTWKAAAPADLLTAKHNAEEDEGSAGEEGGVDRAGVKEDAQASSTDPHGKEDGHDSRETPVEGGQPPSQQGSKVHQQLGEESPRIGANEFLLETGGMEAAHRPRPPISSRRSGKREGNATEPDDRPAEEKAAATGPDDHKEASDTAAKVKQANAQQLGERQRQVRHRQREQERSCSDGFSWVVFAPAIELTVSDHYYPLLQLCVQDMTLSRTWTSALTRTSLVQCQRASVRVYGRGRWDAFLLPSAAITWSLTQSVSRHSSNQHVLLDVENVHVQCSHLIVTKLLYISRRLKALSGSLQKRFAAASMALTGEAVPFAADVTVSVITHGDGAELQYQTGSVAQSVMSDESSSSSSSRSRSDDDEAHGSDNGTCTDTSTEDGKQLSRRRVRASATRPAAKGSAPVSVTADPAATESAPSSRYKRSDAVMAGAPVGFPATDGMATHRLLNSFCYTLFAGICEREPVIAVADADAHLPSNSARDGVNGKEKALGFAEAVPMIWRCKELYCLPPVSATDIFISYRRARSLVLTFFAAGSVEWDADAEMWVLSASGETELAVKAAVAMRGPGGNTYDRSGELATHVEANWFPFTALQYGVAQSVAVRSTMRVEAAAPSTGASTPLSRDGPAEFGGSGSSTYNGGDRGLNPRPRTLDAVGNSEFSSYKIQTYALALTCVDPEEEAESLRYPIVVVPGEAKHALNTERQGGSRCARDGGVSAALVTFRRASMLVSRQTSASYVDSASGDTAVMNDCAAPLSETERDSSGRSVDLVGDKQHVSHDVTQACNGSGHPTSSSAAVQHQHCHRSYVSTPTFAQTSRPQFPSCYRRYSFHGSTVGGGGVPTSAASRMCGQGGSRTAAGPATADSSGDGDLLVVHLQARSSLLNETGCTLQLRSLAPTATEANSSTAAAVSCVTVPPGWRLPLEDESVHNEILLRVCCPSARWVSTMTDAPTSNHDDDDGNDDNEGPPERDGEAESSAVFGGASADRWYEARLVLGDLDSGRFLSLNRVSHTSRRLSEATVSGTVPTAAVAASSAFEDQDTRPLILFVVINNSYGSLIRHISFYPRLTLVNHLGVNARVAVFQQDPAAGPQTPDEAMLLAPWTAPYVGRRRHERERFHRSLVALGAHDALPHQHALPLHFCTYSSNLVLGLSFSQSTGDTLITADLEPVVTHLREVVDHHPRMLILHDSHGRAFYVQVSVMPRTVVLSVALWVYNLTEYPLLLCDSVVTRRLCPGQSSTTGIIPSQGEPFLIGCRLVDFTQGFFSIGLDGGWSGAVPIDVGSTGVFVSAQSQLGIQRSCNYSILFPNAQEGCPIVLQITPRWVFYNNTQKRLRIHFRFPGLAKAMREAEKKRRQLLMQKAESQTTDGAGGGDAAATPKGNRVQCQADDNVSTLSSLATVQLNPGDYHVSCVGPIEGNRLCVQEVLEGVLPSITSFTKDNKVEHRDVAAYYESHLTPYMGVDGPGEATFNLWAAPRAPGKRMAVSYGGNLIVQRPVFPHPTWLEPHDADAADAVITGRIAVEVQNIENVLTVLLQPIQGTKILLQNRTAQDTVMVRQQGSRRRNRIPPRQNRFFLWEDARQEHITRVHILGFKGRWFDVDFSAGECQVTYHEDSKAAAEAEALAAAQQAHPWPTHVKSGAVPLTPFSFFVRGYANLDKTRVTIIVTESAIPLYASIDAWRTSSVISLQVSMVRLSWIQEMSAGVAAAVNSAVPLGAAAAGANGDDAEGAVIVVDTEDERRSKKGHNAVDAEGNQRQTPPTENSRSSSSSAAQRRARSAFAPSCSVDVPPMVGLKSFTTTPLLFSVVLEGVHLERLSTEDTENFFFAIHQMQWIDERLGSVFLYRARPRLPPVVPANGAALSSSPPTGSTTASPLSSSGMRVSRRSGACLLASSPPSSSSRRGGVAMLLPKAAIVATAAAHRLLNTVLGQSGAFLLTMEKQNDVEFSYNFIKYADGVTRFTELHYALTPLVVILNDFWLADMIQEAQRLRVLLGLRKHAVVTQTTTTTTVPMMMLTAPAPPQQTQRPEALPLPVQASSVSGTNSADAGEAVTEVVVVVAGDEQRSTQANWSALHRLSSRIRRRIGSDVVVEAIDDSAAAVSPPSSPLETAKAIRVSSSATPASHSNTAAGEDSLLQAPAQVYNDSGAASRHSTRAPERVPSSTPVSSAPPSAATTAVCRSPKSALCRSRTRRSSVQQQQRSTNAAANAAGFVPQGVFLLQLVHEVRVRLQRQGTGLMAGSLASVTAPGGKRGKSGTSMNPLRSVGGLVGAGSRSGGHRRQLASTTVRHRRGALQRGSAGDGLAGVSANVTDIERAHSTAGATGGDPMSTGTLTTTTATAMAANSHVNTASFMFIERLEVHRITLYVTLHRHRPDPLRPILGAYTWMLPSQLDQREFYLPEWTLTQQVETAASLRARLLKWGTHSLREQWTKVTKLGTLLDALQFWQHRILPLHGPPQTLTLARVQRQRQEREGKPILFAPCVSSGEDSDEERSRQGGRSAAPMSPLSP